MEEGQRMAEDSAMDTRDDEEVDSPEPEEVHYPNMDLANKCFLLESTGRHEDPAVRVHELTHVRVCVHARGGNSRFSGCNCAAPRTVMQVVKSEIMEEVKKDSMAPFYELLCERHGWEVDTGLLSELK